MDYSKLFHEESDFARDTYIARMKEFGFKNMARMELFLWDLELFLQIQKILGDRSVLKGGAATQFYLPRGVQRYLKRAEEEWTVRKEEGYDLEQVIVDVRKQLLRYEMVDSGEDAELKKYVNDFHSLYLNSKVEYSPQSVAEWT